MEYFIDNSRCHCEAGSFAYLWEVAMPYALPSRTVVHRIASLMLAARTVAGGAREVCFSMTGYIPLLIIYIRRRHGCNMDIFHCRQYSFLK